MFTLPRSPLKDEISLQSRRYYRWILVAAFVLRLIWAIAVPVEPVSDSNAYDTFAKNLANCQNYGWDCDNPTAYWPVGTSFIYALLYRTFGHHYAPIVGLNLLLGLATIWLSMYLAERWFNRRVAVITGVLLALWVSQIQFVTVLASEPIFTFLIVAALALWEAKGIRFFLKAVLLGVVLAAASYVRPTALLAPVLLMFLRYMKTKEILRSLASAVIMLTVMALLIAPWTLRNAQAFGRAVTISTNGGANLWMGNNPASSGGYMDLPPETKGMNEAERDRYLKDLAIAHIKERPDLFAIRTVKRVVDTYSRESIGVAWNETGLSRRYGNWILLPLKILNQLYWLPVLGLSLIGVFLCIQLNGWLAAMSNPSILFWGYFTAVNAVIVAQDRYHFPSIPMIGMLAAAALIYLLDQMRGGNRKVNGGW